MSQLWANVAVSRLFSAPLRSPFRSPSPSWGTQVASETKAESLVKQAGAENTEGGRACRSQLPVKWGEGERAWEVAEGRAMGIDALEWLRQRWGMRKMTVYLSWQDGLYSRHHVLLASVFIQTLEHLLSACTVRALGDTWRSEVRWERPGSSASLTWS